MGLVCRLFGHQYDGEGICTRCKSAAGSAGLTFKRLRDKSGYALVSFGKCRDAAVTVPRQIKGKPVRLVEAAAFCGYPVPYAVSLPAEVETVKERAFADTPLTALTFAGPCALGEGVFEHCTALSDAPIPRGTEHIPARAFAGCRGLTEVTLPETVRTLGEGAFADCDALAHLTCSAPLWGEAAAFDGCRSLTAVTLPPDMQELPDRYLRACRSLTQLTLPPALTRIGHEALRGCSGIKALDLPDTLTALGAGALAECTAIEELTLPNSPLTPETDAEGNGDTLRGCTALRSLTLYPDTVARFPRGMIADCTALADIPFVEGKSLHWRAIEKEEGWDEGAGTYVVHLINGRIRKGS